MKYKIKLILACIIAAFTVVSCIDYEALTYDVEKPESIAALEYLKVYENLKDYIDRAAAGPNFKLGVGTLLNDFNNKGVKYRLITANFDQITLGNEMKHASIVQNDGKLNFGNLGSLLTTAKEAGISVYGHTLVWHAQQNTKYLNSLIAATSLPGEGGYDPSVITNSDFEEGIGGGWNSWGLDSKRSWAEGEGRDGSNALKFENPRGGQSWEAQVAYDFPDALEDGAKYQLKFWVKGSVEGSISADLQNPNGYAGRGSFGSMAVTTEWTEITKETTVGGDNAKRFLFNCGAYVGNLLFDDVTLCRENSGGGSGGVKYTEMVTNGDMATDDLQTSFFFTNNANPTIVTDSEKGRVMKIESPNKLGNDWDLQFWVLINPPAKEDETYIFSMDVRSEKDCGFPTQAHYKPQQYIHWDMVGSISSKTGWTNYQRRVTISPTHVGDKGEVGAIAFNLGHIETTVYITNVSLLKEEKITGEKTPEEKEEILTAELERWIKGMMGFASDVKEWDVVNEPMSDWPDVYQLKTGIGKQLAANEFYWQDYLGKDYAVKAINFARKYGDDDLKLFINDYGLEGDGNAKCKGLIAYVEYVESKGAKVDGIGTQMHISLDTRRESIEEMYKLLAATGKLIKITELDIGLGIIDKNHPVPWEAPVITTPMATNELYLEQADLYRFVVEKYFEHIPAAQRAGITIWSPYDSPAGSGWRPNEPVGLWTQGLVRKHAYGGYANGLAGRDINADSK